MDKKVMIREPMTAPMIAEMIRGYYLDMARQHYANNPCLFFRACRGVSDSSIRKIVADIRNRIENSDYEDQIKKQYLPFQTGRLWFYPPVFVGLVLESKEIPHQIIEAIAS
jgi:hypothetical protein